MIHIPDLGIVVLGADASHLRTTNSLAARGYLAQDANADEFVATARTVATGLTVLDTSLISNWSALPIARTTGGSSDEEAVRPRETEGLQLRADGLPNKIIVAQLGMSEHIAKFHVSAVLTAARRGLLLL